MAVFTCSLSADAPCLWQDKRAIMIISCVLDDFARLRIEKSNVKSPRLINKGVAIEGVCGPNASLRLMHRPS